MYSQKRDVLDILSHVLCVHGLIPQYVNSINISWYLGALVIFYFMIPFIHDCFHSFESMLLAVASSLVLCDMVSTLFFVVSSEKYRAYWSSYCFISWLPVIVLGMFLKYILDNQMINRIKRKKLLSYIIVGAVGYLSMVCGVYRQNVWGIVGFRYTGALLFSLLIVSQMIHPSVFICNKFMSCLGKYSYGIYLSHYIILTCLMEHVKIINMEIYTRLCIYFITVVIASFLLSVIVTKTVEVPTLNLIRRREV